MRLLCILANCKKQFWKKCQSQSSTSKSLAIVIVLTELCSVLRSRSCVERAGPVRAVQCSQAARPRRGTPDYTHTHNEHAEKHELKGIFDKKNQGDSTFYDQTVIHTQAVYVQKAQFYEVC